MMKRETSQALTCDNCGRAGRLYLRRSGQSDASPLRASDGFTLLTTNKTWVRCTCGADVWFARD